MIDLTSGISPPLFILPPIPYHQSTPNSFNPPSLPYHLSNHRLLTSTVLETLTPLTTYCQLPATTPFARSSQDPSILFTIRHLRDLLSHNAFTDDEVMCLFTDLLCQSCPGVTYTKTYFSHFFTTVGWQRAKAFLSPHITSSRRTYNHPSISGESVILIPFFVNTNHWVAISRHERQGSVTFLYADDLNSPSTETRIKRLLSNTDPAFYPQNANWMNCYNTTYTPHANKCGPRTLLALAAMALCTNPSRNILSHLMHPNLAQISRVWVAASILKASIDKEPFYSQTNTPTPCRQVSLHTSLIHWGNNNTRAYVPSARESISLGKHGKHLPSSSQPKTPVVHSVNSAHINTQTQTSVLQTPPHMRRKPSMSGSIRNQPEESPAPANSFILMNSKKSDRTGCSNIPKPIPRTTIKIREPEAPSTISKFYRTPTLNTQRSLPSNIHPLCPTTLTWGHAPSPIDSSETFCIVLQNPNGLRIQQSIAELSLGNKICHSLGTGLISLPETNVNWNQPYQYTRVYHTLCDQWETSSIQTSLHPEKHRSQSQRGGTLQILTDYWVSRLKDKGMDPYGLGRWSYMILNGRGNKSIAIITAYRPCSDTPSSAGNKTVYMQQFRTLLAYNNSIKSLATPNPHRQFTLDLQAWISKLQSSGHSIILCLDSNEHISQSDGKYEPLEYTEGSFTSSPTHPGKISSLAVTCGLCDSLDLFHPPPYC
jgi:hypothetical protein